MKKIILILCGFILTQNLFAQGSDNEKLSKLIYNLDELGVDISKIDTIYVKIVSQDAGRSVPLISKPPKIHLNVVLKQKKAISVDTNLTMIRHNLSGGFLSNKEMEYWARMRIESNPKKFATLVAKEM